MSNEQELSNLENHENEPLDELALEELDQIVGAGGKQHTPPPEKPATSLTFTMTDCVISA